MEHRGTGFGGLFTVPSGAPGPACGGWMERLEQFSGGCSLFHPARRVRGRTGAGGRGAVGDACRTLLGRLRLIVLS